MAGDEQPMIHVSGDVTGIQRSQLAVNGDTLVDLIYCPKGLPVDDALIARGEELSVLGMDIRVMALEDVMATKLMALSEQEPDFRAVLEIARSLREQIDWAYVRRRTETSAFAAAFFTLVESLDIAPREVEPAVAV